MSSIMDTYGSFPGVKQPGPIAGNSLHAVQILRVSWAIHHGVHSDKFIYTVWRFFNLFHGVVYKYGDIHLKRRNRMCNRFRDFIEQKKLQFTYKTLSYFCRKEPVTLVFSCGERDTNYKASRFFFLAGSVCQNMLIRSSLERCSQYLHLPPFVNKTLSREEKQFLNQKIDNKVIWGRNFVHWSDHVRAVCWEPQPKLLPNI
jgi:hypothetical protein